MSSFFWAKRAKNSCESTSAYDVLPYNLPMYSYLPSYIVRGASKY